MRYPTEQKAETREKIVATAARSFREHGSEANGIGPVMSELGLTKGGFYRHFDSKDDLYAEAVARAFDELGDRLAAVAANAPRGRELQAVIDAYLSVEHASAPGNGCPLAALSPEIARYPATVRKRIRKAMAGYGERLVPYVAGRTIEEKRAHVFLLFSGMAGVLAAVRAVGDAQSRDQMLAAARSLYVANFAGTTTK